MSEIGQLESIEQVPPERWDALVDGSGFYQSHGWLRGQQRPEIATAGYLTVEESDPGTGQQRLTAAAPYYRYPAGRAPQLPAVAEGLRVLRVGTRTGYHNDFLLDPDPVTARAALADLIAALAEQAAADGCDALLFDHLTTGSLQQLAGLHPVRAQLRTAEAVIHNPGGTFASYRELLGRNARKRDYEIRRFAASGLRLATAPLSTCIDELAPLLAQTADRYDAALAEAEIRAYLTAQAAALDERSTVFRCLTEDGTAIGGSVLFTWRDTLYARVAGFDYARTRGAFEYFNAVCYGPVHHMERTGATALHLGPSALEAKVRRGAALHPLWAALVPLPLVRASGLHRDEAADRALADELRQTAGGGMDDKEWHLDAVAPQ